MEDMDNAVKNVIAVAKVTIPMAPNTPAFPTTQGLLRYMITPNMVNKVGVKTP